MHPHKVFTITALTATLLVPSVSLAAASANRPPCILNEHRVTLAIDVDSAGNGFRVRFIAKSPGGAKEVLRRARLLVD